jgi:hypothetical protein
MERDYNRSQNTKHAKGLQPVSTRRKLRTINGGRLTRPRHTWTGKRRDTGATYVGTNSHAGERRGLRKRVEEAAEVTR